MNVKITAVKLFYVPVRFLFVKVETDEGISGWGEPLVEGRAATLEACVKEWSQILIGQDPLKIEYLWQTMYRRAFYRGGAVMMSAISGIDQALWDIKGKYYGVPVYELLGGAVKKKIKVYRTLQSNVKSEMVEDARLGAQQGYKLLKFTPPSPVHFVDSFAKVDEILDCAEALRNAVGDGVDLAMDFHGRIHKPMTKTLLKELEPYRLAFVEEAVIPTNNEALRQLSERSSIRLATGERMYSRWDFRPLLESGCIDIVQPDISHAGGLSESRRIATMAEAYDVALAPHCPLSVVAFAASVQLDAMSENAVFQEQKVCIHDVSAQNPNFKWIKDPEGTFAYRDGFMDIPTKPGLGIEIDEEAVEEANRTPHNWKNPLWETEDGTPIEW